MDGMERSSGSFIKDAQKRRDCTDEELIKDARRRGAIDKDLNQEGAFEGCRRCRIDKGGRHSN
jgi:hypothetical protein